MKVKRGRKKLARSIDCFEGRLPWPGRPPLISTTTLAGFGDGKPTLLAIKGAVVLRPLWPSDRIVHPPRISGTLTLLLWDRDIRRFHIP